MLIGLIFFIIIFSAGISFLLKWRKIRTAYIWFFLVISVFFATIVLFLFPTLKFDPLQINNWFSIKLISVGLLFKLDTRNWPLAFSIIGFLPAFLLTGVAGLNVRRDVSLWAIQIIFCAVSFLAVLAANLWTVIVFWSAMDMMHFLFRLAYFPEIKKNYLFRSLSIRLIGVLLLILSTSRISIIGINPMIENIPANNNSVFFLSAILHSGFLPIQFQNSEKTNPRKNTIIDKSISAIILAVSFSLLNYFRLNDFLLLPIIIFVSFLFVILILAGYLWAFKNNSQTEFDILPAFAASQILLQFIGGRVDEINYLIATLLLVTFYLSLYSYRSRSTIIFAILFTFIISGLPFTINTFGSRGLFKDGIDLIQAILLIAFVFIPTGFLKNARNKQEDFHLLDPWYQAIYLCGIFIPVLIGGSIAIKNLSNPINETRYWWIGAAVLVCALTINFFYKQYHPLEKLDNYRQSKGLSTIFYFFSLDWLFNIGREIESRFERVVIGFSRLLDGEGGILWAFVFLVLILTILQ